MPPSRPLRRRTPVGTRRRTGMALAAAGLLFAVAACSGGGAATPHGVVDGPTSAADPAATTTGAGTPTPTLTFSTPTGTSSLLNYPHLFAAMAVVPQEAAVVTYTDLDLVKKRLGYAHVTSTSPTHERFDFWERARADGAMFVGTRLYDASSLMAIDYGWTGEDVAWEVDFALTEDGCGRSMLCETAHGYVLGLRPDLSWSIVTKSLQDNGFEPDVTDPDTFRNDNPKAPFDRIHLIQELHAVAGGNAIGVQRIADVINGAPPYAPTVADIYDRLGTVESLHSATGCVDLRAALGPDSGGGDVTAFLKHNVISNLAPAVSTTLSVAGPHDVTLEVKVGAGATADDLAARLAAVRSWPGQQTGTPFKDVAAIDGDLNGDYESLVLDVRDMAVLRTMVLTDDAPWALCPYPELR